VVESLPSKQEVLSSKSTTTTKKENKIKKKEMQNPERGGKESLEMWLNCTAPRGRP
jgi:hypothetical protein